MPNLCEAARRGAERGVLPEGVVAACWLGLELLRRGPVLHWRGLLLRQQLRGRLLRRLDLRTIKRMRRRSRSARDADILPTMPTYHSRCNSCLADGV